MLLAARELEGFLWIGGAYFTLRHLHVMIDWWRESIDRPTLRQYLHYHLFLPVIMAGPIHRIQNFRRQTERRRWDPAAFCCGAERLLLGAGQYVVVAGWLLEKVKALILAGWPGPGGFGHEWLLSVFFWVQLYLSFSALTSIALGLALMMGLKLEENFDRPWAAPDLVAFWTRWHMTLSHWCRDYVFRSVAALTRLPVVGLVAAMLAMGLWHDSSLYYVLWAMWQSLGIVVTRLWLRHVPVDLPRSVARVAGPAFVLVWLTLTRPVIVEVMGAFA
jgi:alginate O-acetyltransferase complex protein AlgI